MESAAPAADSFSATGVMSGVVHGGQFPIYNATVNLYAAGTTGYGSAATLLATTTTSPTGGFSFNKQANGTASSGATWGCPSSDPNPDPQIYITAVGGNTQGTGVTTTNNAASALIAALGPCSTITASTQLQINEVTTAATVFALAQYINPGSGPGAETIGTNGANTSTSTPQGAVGLNNAVAGIVNLANVTTGAAVTSNTYTGASGTTVSSVTVTATPETSKLITIANILAACINTTSSSSNQCADLFASASPPPSASVTSQPSANFVTAQDTIQAAYYMAVNPTDAGTFTSCNGGATTKLGCLFDLPTTTSPFQPGLATAPGDWTLSVSYTAYTSGTTTNLGTSTGTGVSPYNCYTGSGSTHYFLYGPEKSAVDAYGNLWFINSIQHTDNIAAISPIGKPLYCGTAIDPSSPYSAGITIDTAGNIWAEYSNGGSSPQIYKIASPGATPSNPAASYALTAYNATLGDDSVAIVADGYGNVFYATCETSNCAGSSGTGTSVYEIPSGATSGSTLVGSSANVVNAVPYVFGAVDSVGRVYFGANSSGTAASLELTPASAAISSFTVTGTGPYTVAFTTTAAPTFTVTPTTNVILSGLNSANGLLLDRQQLAVTAVTSTGFSVSTATPLATGTSSDTGIAVAVPTGASSYSVVVNSFGIATYGQALDNNSYLYAGTTCCGTGASESLLKATISPTGTAIASAAGNYTFSAQNIGGLTGVRSVALDGADNVWFGNEYASNDGGSSGTNETQNTGIWSIGEVSTSGSGSTATFTALSPAATGLTNGDTCATGTGCPEGGGFQKASLGYTFGLSIDPSGNVWAPNFAVPSGVPVAGYGNANIVEIIGAAVPVVTPLSAGAANGTLATKP
jgi:hypothetical protein